MVKNKKKDKSTVKSAQSSSVVGKTSNKSIDESLRSSHIIKGANADIENLFASGPKPSCSDEKASTEVKKKRSYDKTRAVEGSKNEEDGRTDGVSYGVLQSALPVQIISPEAPLERIDKESGLPVYKAHLLKVGEGGGTALCPFDCDCCF